MKNKKTVLIALGVLAIVSLAALFLPFENLLSRLPYISDIYNNTSLSINAQNGKLVVELNGKEYGETPLQISDLPEGEYLVSLERRTDSEDFYEKESFNINLTKNTEAIINLEIGPAGTKGGYIVYYTESVNSNVGLVTFLNSPKGSSVYLNDEFLTKSNLESQSLKPKEYQILIKHDGYEEIRFPIVIRAGYNLNVYTYLFPDPWELPTAQNNE